MVESDGSLRTSTYVVNSVLQTAANGYYGTRPVVTLSPEVKVTDGDGNSGNPYQLSL